GRDRGGAPVKRRAFLTRTAAAAAALAAPRWLHAQSAPDTARAGAAPASDSTAARADTTAAPSGPTVPLAPGGDTTLGSNLDAHCDEQLAAGMTREQLWPIYFAGVKPLLEAADVAVVNLECPFTERGEKLKKNFNFRARRELVRVLQEGAVDVVS